MKLKDNLYILLKFCSRSDASS